MSDIGQLYEIVMLTDHTDKFVSGQPMNEEYIIAQLRTIISAGYETISATVTVRIFYVTKVSFIHRTLFLPVDIV